MNPSFRNFAIWVGVAALLLVLFEVFQTSNFQGTNTSEVPYSDFRANVDRGEVKDITITGNRIAGKLNNGSTFTTYAPDDPGIIDNLYKSHVKILAKAPEDQGWLYGLLSIWLPLLLIMGLWIFFMRQMQAGGGRAMGFGKSKAKLLTERSGRVTFEDVAGVDEAKEDLQEIVEFLRDPQKFQRLGGKIPRGALLVGPPGTGKTLLARAIAGEANVPFFTISGSDFVEMFVGVGASRVRDMFDQAKKNAPCIIFIDEIDAVGRHRGAGLGGGNDEREQTLNQLLVEMDGFEANEGIILIAATNRPDVLDPALLRPGRFDRQIMVPNPDVAGREKILRVHSRKVPMAPDVDIKILARGTPGFSGADLANLINEGALLAARRNKRMVTQREFEDAKDKVMMGAERRTMVMSDEEKRNTAYHEAGHAIVGLVVPYDPLHKVTIIPRGRALGVTMNLPEGDRYSRTRKWCEARMAVLFGGREAEIILGGPDNVTNGASGDIQMATVLARSMVTEWGMSEKLGRVRYNGNEQEVFLGHSVTQTKNLSDETASLIDAEIRSLIQAGEATARKILSDNPAQLHAVAKALLEFETLSGEEVKRVLAGLPIIRDEGDGPKTGTAVPATGRVRTKMEPDTGGAAPLPA